MWPSVWDPTPDLTTVTGLNPIVVLAADNEEYPQMRTDVSKIYPDVPRGAGWLQLVAVEDAYW